MSDDHRAEHGAQHGAEGGAEGGAEHGAGAPGQSSPPLGEHSPPPGVQPAAPWPQQPPAPPAPPQQPAAAAPWGPVPSEPPPWDTQPPQHDPFGRPPVSAPYAYPPPVIPQNQPPPGYPPPPGQYPYPGQSPYPPPLAPPGQPPYPGPYAPGPYPPPGQSPYPAPPGQPGQPPYPPGSYPPPGHPAPGQVWQTPPPPPGPEKTGADGWPWWYGFASFGIGIMGLMVVVGIFAAIYAGAGGDAEDPAFLVIATILQGVVFAGAAIGMARAAGPVRAVDFGLRRARIGPTIGKIAAILAVYFVVLSVYSELVHLTPDDSADKLGAGDGALGMLGFVLMAAIVAPVAEEFFFRGMVFRSLANGIGVIGGAIVSGLIFGAMHIDSLDQDRLLQIVPLALLGVLFAILYAWSGTLYSTIALHATNNSLAVIVYSSDHDSSLGLALGAGAWVLMMMVCLTGWRLTDRGAAEVQPPPSGP